MNTRNELPEIYTAEGMIKQQLKDAQAELGKADTSDLNAVMLLAGRVSALNDALKCFQLERNLHTSIDQLVGHAPSGYQS